MKLADLPVPAALIERHAANGITDLYPPQAACVEQGLLDGRNLLVAIPTASGKTLVAELAMHRAIAAGGKCLYIVPLRALAAEKYAEFSPRAPGSGSRPVTSTGATTTWAATRSWSRPRRRSTRSSGTGRPGWPR